MMIKKTVGLILGGWVVASVWTMAQTTNVEPVVKSEKAIAIISPLKGHSVRGVFRFEQLKKGVKVTALVTGLTPNQKHGVHVHEWGDLSDQEKGMSAGGHYNPERNLHGLPPSPMRHAGAFGNLEANKHGEATFVFIDDTISVNGDYHPILGRSVVIHEKEDTGEQPLGNAGGRIGFGVIGRLP